MQAKRFGLGTFELSGMGGSRGAASTSIWLCWALAADSSGELSMTHVGEYGVSRSGRKRDGAAAGCESRQVPDRTTVSRCLGGRVWWCSVGGGGAAAPAHKQGSIRQSSGNHEYNLFGYRGEGSARKTGARNVGPAIECEGRRASWCACRTFNHVKGIFGAGVDPLGKVKSEATA